MKLRELEAYFIKIVDDRTTQHVDTLAEAQGIDLLCPPCFVKNGGRVGTHIIRCWFTNRGVPDDRTPIPGRWNVEGTGIDDLTFVGPGAFSVGVGEGNKHWHGYIEHGEANTR